MRTTEITPSDRRHGVWIMATPQVSGSGRAGVSKALWDLRVEAPDRTDPAAEEIANALVGVAAGSMGAILGAM